MIGYVLALGVDKLTGAGLADQQGSFLGLLALHLTVFGILLFRTSDSIPAFKNLLEEATFYDKQWAATCAALPSSPAARLSGPAAFPAAASCSVRGSGAGRPLSERAVPVQMGWPDAALGNREVTAIHTVCVTSLIGREIALITSRYVALELRCNGVP